MKKPNLILDLLTIVCLILIAAIFILSVILVNYDMAVAAGIGLALGIYVLQFRREK
jgi:small-conductance mechanosensitive channel